MAQPLPKFIWIKPEDGDPDYFIADTTNESMVAIGEKVIVGKYQLIETYTIEGIVEKIRRE